MPRPADAHPWSTGNLSCHGPPVRLFRLNEARHPKPGKQCGDKPRNLDLAGAERRDSRPRTEPGNAPADAEYRRATDQPRVDIASRGQLEPLFDHRFITPQYETIADKGGHQRAAHHEDQARVPCSGDIEEIEYLGRVDHTRYGDPNAKDQADEEG